MSWCACCTSRSEDGSGPAVRLVPKPSGAEDSDAGTHWITDDEAKQIVELRAALTDQERAQLESAPEDIKHDLTMCRFLRGHKGKPGGPLKALRKHLQFRQKFAETITQARALFQPGAEDYRAECTLFADKINPKFTQLQLPPWQGTNTGMPVSLVVTRLFDLTFLGSESEDELRRWFISCLEQRSFTLFNQSIRERRVAKVLEARDCLGFSFSQLMVSPKVLFRLRSVFQDGDNYPELLLRLQIFNLEPGSRYVGFIKSLMDDEMKTKVLFGDCGEWVDTVGLPNVISPAALPVWEKHLADNGGMVDGWRQIDVSVCQQTSSYKVNSGEACEWRVQAAPSESSSRKSQKALVVKVHFFRLREQLEFTGCRMVEEWRIGAGEECSGKFVAWGTGVVLVEATLDRGAAPMAVSLTCGPHAADGKPRAVSELPASFAKRDRGWVRGSRKVMLAFCVALSALWIASSTQLEHLSKYREAVPMPA